MNPNLNISEDELELIEAYFRDELNKEDKANFDKRLAADSDFKHIVEDLKQTFLGIEAAALKDKLSEFHDAMEPSEEKTRINSTKIKPLRAKLINYMVAASLITFGLFWYLNNQSSPNRLFDKHFSADPGLPTTMSSQENYFFFDGMVSYKQGNYKLAIQKWEPLIKNDPENDTLNYFLGVAYLAEKNDAEALPYLENTLKINDGAFTQEARYYKALAFIKRGDVEKAKQILSENSSERSQNLLRELSK